MIDNNDPYHAAKHDNGKTRLDLIWWPSIEGIGKVLTMGAAKYSANSWQNVPDGRSRYFAAAMRHMLAWWGGERCDPESGLPHLFHAACNLMFLSFLDERGEPTK